MEDLARSLGIAPAAPSPSSASSSSSDMSTRPTRREARDILRHLGVPVASESDITWISTPTPYRAGRPRLVVLTSHLLVYLRGLDQFQAAYNRAMDAKKTWDIDWTGAVENLAYAGEAWDDANNNDNNSNASPLAPPTLAEVVHRYIPSLTFMNQVVPHTTNTHHGVNVTDDDRTELLSVHFRPRDAWLGDPSSTRMRHIAVRSSETHSALNALKDAMRSRGRTSQLCWAERPSKTTTVLYLRRASDEYRALVAVLLQICRDHGLVPTPDPNVNRNNVIVARTPPGARTTMETRLRLGRHPVKGEMLVLEYARWETEAAAVQGLKVAGAVAAVAAFGALGIAAAAALNVGSAAATSHPRVGAGVRYGSPGVRSGANRRRSGVRVRSSPLWSWRGDLTDLTAVFNGTSTNGVAPMSSTEAAGVSSAGTHQSGDQAGGRSYIVRADDPSLGSGVTARDGFHEIFSRNLRAALANAGYVEAPTSPAMFALVREPSLPRGDHQGADSSAVPGDGDDVTAGIVSETEDWTLVLTPETAWATAEDEPSAPPSESPNDDQNGSQNNQNNQNNQNDEAGGQSNRPAAATNPTPTAELIDPGAIDDTAGATNSNEKGSSMGTLRVDVDAAGVPKHFLCPITHEVFDDPVIYADGHTYSRCAIQTWLRRSEASPMTGERLVTRGMPAVLLPNHAMRSQVEEWKEAAGYDPGMAVDR